MRFTGGHAVRIFAGDDLEQPAVGAHPGGRNQTRRPCYRQICRPACWSGRHRPNDRLDSGRSPAMRLRCASGCFGVGPGPGADGVTSGHVAEAPRRGGCRAAACAERRHSSGRGSGRRCAGVARQTEARRWCPSASASEEFANRCASHPDRIRSRAAACGHPGGEAFQSRVPMH